MRPVRPPARLALIALAALAASTLLAASAAKTFNVGQEVDPGYRPKVARAAYDGEQHFAQRLGLGNFQTLFRCPVGRQSKLPELA